MIQRYTPRIQRWDPFAEIAQLQKSMNEAFGSGNENRRAFPPVNVRVDENLAVVTAELPGIDPEKVEISMDAETLTLAGVREAEVVADGETFSRQERYSGKFSRTVELPFSVEKENVKARLRHGILTVELPRAEADKPRKIEVKSE